MGRGGHGTWEFGLVHCTLCFVNFELRRTARTTRTQNARERVNLVFFLITSSAFNHGRRTNSKDHIFRDRADGLNEVSGATNLRVFVAIFTNIMARIIFYLAGFLGSREAFRANILCGLAGQFFSNTFRSTSANHFIYVYAYRTFRDLSNAGMNCTAAKSSAFFSDDANDTWDVICAIFLFFRFRFAQDACVRGNGTATRFNRAFLRFFLVMITNKINGFVLSLIRAIFGRFTRTVAIRSNDIILKGGGLITYAWRVSNDLFGLRALFFTSGRTTDRCDSIFRRDLTAIARSKDLRYTCLRLHARAICCRDDRDFTIGIFDGRRRKASTLCNQFRSKRRIFRVKGLLIVSGGVKVFRSTFRLLNVDGRVY